MEPLNEPLLEYAVPPKRRRLDVRASLAGVVLAMGLWGLLFLWGDGSMIIACFANPPFEERRFGVLGFLRVTYWYASVGVPGYKTYEIGWLALVGTVGITVGVVWVVVYATRRLLRR